MDSPGLRARDADETGAEDIELPLSSASSSLRGTSPIINGPSYSSRAVLPRSQNLKHESAAATIARAFSWTRLKSAARRAAPIIFALVAGAAILALVVVFVVRAVMSGAWDPSVVGKTMIVHAMPDTVFTRAQGMFAEFTAVIGALHYGLNNGAVGVKVDFRTPFYVDPARGPSWFAYFFEPTIALTPPPGTPASKVEREQALVVAQTAPEVDFNSWLSRFGKLGSFSQVLSAGAEPHPDPDYARFPFPVTTAVPMPVVRELVQSFVRPLPSLRASVDRVWREELGLKDGDFVIGLHYRGLDKIDAYPFVPAPPDLFRALVDEVVRLYAPPPTWRVYVATDTEDFVEWARGIWGERVAARSISRIRVADVKYDVDGTPIPLHKTRSVAPYDRAEGAVIDMMLLSRTSYIIKNRSSLSDVSLAFAPPGTNYSFVLGPDDAVYSSDPRVPKRLPFGEAAFMAGAAEAAAKAKAMGALRKPKRGWWSSFFWYFLSIA